MLGKESPVVTSCNISSLPRLIYLLSLDVHVVQKVMWAGIRRESGSRERAGVAFNQPQEGR